MRNNSLSRISPRIISGKFKGTRLNVPKSARPITDRVKKTVFDILGDGLKGKKVLDLFAGSGNLGVEALSNGASEVTFLEVNEEGINCINTNLKKLKIKENAIVVKGDYRKSINNLGKFDIIFIDPPFHLIDKFSPSEILGLLEDTGLIIFKTKTSSTTNTFESLNIVDKRIIGINTMYFLTK